VKLIVPARMRKVIFWAHLCTAALAGIFIFVMSVTGALLAYQQEITDWGNRVYRSGPPSPGATKLPLETLVARLREADPSVTPSQIVVSSDVDAPLSVRLGGQEGARTVFVNPYTAAIVLWRQIRRWRIAQVVPSAAPGEEEVFGRSQVSAD
jgi:uncharacterized iron-regulated membrane protein